MTDQPKFWVWVADGPAEYIYGGMHKSEDDAIKSYLTRHTVPHDTLVYAVAADGVTRRKTGVVDA